jgi:hypothetical protein
MLCGVVDATESGAMVDGRGGGYDAGYGCEAEEGTAGAGTAVGGAAAG